jgi:hypothetical protein
MELKGDEHIDVEDVLFGLRAKAAVAPVFTMKACRGSTDTAALIVDFSTITSTTSCCSFFIPRRIAPISPSHGRLDGPQSRYGCFGKEEGPFLLFGEGKFI